MTVRRLSGWFSIAMHNAIACKATPIQIALIATTLALATAGTANAAGCLKGAVVGGVAGHYAGHYAKQHASQQAKPQGGQRQASQAQ